MLSFQMIELCDNMAVLPVRGCVAAEPDEIILVVAAAEEEGDLDGARTLGRTLHRAPHPERLDNDSISM